MLRNTQPSCLDSRQGWHPMWEALPFPYEILFTCHTLGASGTDGPFPLTQGARRSDKSKWLMESAPGCPLRSRGQRPPLPRHPAGPSSGDPHDGTEAGLRREHSRAAGPVRGPGAEPGVVAGGLDLGIGPLTRQATPGPCSEEVSPQLLWLSPRTSTFLVRNDVTERQQAPPSSSRPVPTHLAGEELRLLG